MPELEIIFGSSGRAVPQETCLTGLDKQEMCLNGLPACIPRAPYWR